MQSQWDDRVAATFEGPLAQRVYTSRLLGRDHSLVLHGGGNTSVKIRERNVFGDEQDILYVKGSGWDLETIEAAGFAPLRLDTVRRLATLEALSDPQMVQELRAAMTNPAAPAPSVETILHAILPYPFVDHTHADALLGDHQHRRRRTARARDLRRHAWSCCRTSCPASTWRASPPSASPREPRPAHDRHGAAQPRLLFVRRDRPRVATSG